MTWVIVLLAIAAAAGFANLVRRHYLSHAWEGRDPFTQGRDRDA